MWVDHLSLATSVLDGITRDQLLLSYPDWAGDPDNPDDPDDPDVALLESSMKDQLIFQKFDMVSASLRLQFSCFTLTIHMLHRCYSQ